MQRWFAVGLMGLVANLANAQGSASQGQAAPPNERTYRSHSAPTSRDLFRACDADGDDRLDVFETSKALETVRDAKDQAGFARLDQDRDGFLTWPEFDANFRTAVQNGGTFRVRPLRRVLQAAPQPQSATPLQQFLQLHDGNQSGGLDAAELEKLVRQGSVPPGASSQLRQLDLDRSGEVDESELASWFEQLPGATRAPTKAAVSGSLLPPPWNVVDADQDNQINASELAQLLRPIDPGLARWSSELLQGLDLDKSGKLTANEIAAATAATAGPGPLPKHLPLR